MIFWEQAGPDAQPAPVAVLIDASEPLRRTRMLPAEVETEDDTPVKRLELAPREWLNVAEGAGGDAIIDRLVYAPGDQRLLMTLKPGARGKILQADLVRLAFPLSYLDGPAATDARFPILAETLARAPWEEVD